MDDLSGLDWSSKPAAAQPKPPIMNSSFASLRPTPSPLGSGSGRNTPASIQATNSGPTAPPAKPAQDSFSNLMNFGSVKANQNLSLAERQAQLELEKRKKEEERKKQAEAQFGNGQFWDNLGSRGSTGSPALQPPKPSNGMTNDDDDLFAAFNKDTQVDKSSHYPPPESQRSTPASAARLDLGNPSAWGSAPASSNVAALATDDDDDPFGLNELKPSTTPAPARTQTSNDDDFLGDLGRPVEEVRKKQQVTRPEPGKPIEREEEDSSDEETRGPPPAPQQRRGGNDPFDKAVAQLVDYGFAPEDARRGLVESGAGINVQAAANWLLDDAHRKSREKAQGRSSSATSSRSQARDGRSPARGEPDLAKSAASVGNSLFKTANSLWKTSSKKVQQAMADFQQDGDPNQPKWMRDAQQTKTQGRARPEGDVTDEALMLEAGGRPQPARNNSRQGAEPRQAPSRQPERRPSPAQSSGSRSNSAPRWQQSAAPAVSDTRSRLNRLGADDDDFAINVSSSRRRPARTPEPKQPEPEVDLLFNSQAPAPSQSLPQRPAQAPSKQPTPRSTPRPAQPAAKRPQPTPRATPPPARRIPPITPVALQTSTKHRVEGTAHFKRGDYAAAHTSYSSSIAAVPSDHPLMILLLTNRALTALKTGEPKQAVTDADNAIQLIGPSNGQGESVAIKGDNGQDEQKDMKELYGKALSRKAEALEQMEKWADAGAVWQQCVQSGVGGPNAIKGRQRCQNALAPKPKPAPRPAASRPKPSATASLAPQKSSEAVTRLREANEAAAKEDDEKFALSEKVDAKVSAWRDGKRDNLRALLGSLDAVLWENSGWKKVGLHELVMANKVKIAYMKAIAKTHPDKLPQDANTEVRLIAGLVFSTLNESWDKFKAENGL
ncbi:UBA domain-containing protein [Paramyrothecium foliicola]|nr:UBA domain-containing protein [Paramyrothecium foliicola]